MTKIKIKLNQIDNVFFYDITHSYLTKDDRTLMGVTGLMKKYNLSPDYSGISQMVLLEAAERGSEVHKLIELYCKGEEDKEQHSVYAIAALGAFQKLELKDSVLANEYLVSDGGASIASSIDMVLNDYTLVDIKTTSKLHDNALSWQLSIYKYLFELQNPECKVPKLMALWLHEGKATLKEVKEIEMEEVIRLIEANKNDLPFIPKEGCCDLVTTEEDKEVAEALKALELRINEQSVALKELEAQKKDMQKKILSLMASGNVVKWKVSDTLSFTRILPFEKSILDSKRLKEERPEIYDEYKKTSLTSESLRINIS